MKEENKLIVFGTSIF